MALSRDQLLKEYPFNANPSAPFTSSNEMVAAMTNPKYAIDHGFQDVVMARLAVTDRASWGLSHQREQINSTMHHGFELTRDDEAEEPSW